MTHTVSTKRGPAAMIASVPALHIGKLDIAFTVLVSAFALFLGVGYVAGTTIDGDYMQAHAAVVPLFLLITLPLLLRSSAPLHGLALSIVGVGIHFAATGDLFRCGPVYLVAFLMAFSAALRLPIGKALGGLGLSIALCMVMAAAGDGEAGLILQPAVVLIWGAGRLVRSRTRMNEELEARTSALKVARDERARLEVSVDRARLSAELDELLKRRLAHLARMAEAGGAQQEAAVATGTLVDIERESRRTLEEMRELVGVLRSDDGVASVAPPPTLAHLEALLLQVKGGEARLTVAGDPRALPAGVELSAYRVVEHLLAALHDAPSVEVEVRFAEDALGLRVAGATRRRDLGPAVDRARERVQLHRGTLETTTRGGHAEAVARLPVGAIA